jgi:hypothetical protein
MELCVTYHVCKTLSLLCVVSQIIQSAPSLARSQRCILILSSHQGIGLQKDSSFSLSGQHYVRISYRIHATCFALLSYLNLIMLIMFGEEQPAYCYNCQYVLSCLPQHSVLSDAQICIHIIKLFGIFSSEWYKNSWKLI